jgi:hypothetical protein
MVALIAALVIVNAVIIFAHNYDNKKRKIS